MNQNITVPKMNLSKVPEITAYFWIIKVLCTTVGETASDYLSVGMGLGLVTTSIIMGALLLVALIVQFLTPKYTPSIYWVAVVLVSIFGTLVTDYLTDVVKVPLETSTVLFTAALGGVFAVWYRVEKDISVHSIRSKRREFFYWLAILVTFALGTASGDLMAEGLGLGYLVSGLITCGVIAATFVAWRLKLNSILTFWIAYILTRPLGASLGDYLSQPVASGGLGFGTVITSFIFLTAILAVILYLTITKNDLTTLSEEEPMNEIKGTFFQTAITVGVLLIAGFSSYQWYHHKLQTNAAALTSNINPLGDLSSFKKITVDTLGLVHRDNFSEAKDRVTDLETAWDNAQASLKNMNSEKWTYVDDAIDEALKALRTKPQKKEDCIASLDGLISKLNELDHPKE